MKRSIEEIRAYAQAVPEALYADVDLDFRDAPAAARGRRDDETEVDVALKPGVHGSWTGKIYSGEHVICLYDDEPGTLEILRLVERAREDLLALCDEIEHLRKP